MHRYNYSRKMRWNIAGTLQPALAVPVFKTQWQRLPKAPLIISMPWLPEII